MIEEDITDIVAILRECADNSRKTEGDYYADQYAIAAEVFDEAANVIERLRNEVARQRLTGAEREAILAMACHCDTRAGLEWHKYSATLRALLERTK
jgi:hypothetical protein